MLRSPKPTYSNRWTTGTHSGTRCKSVENLIDQLAPGQVPPPPLQSQPLQPVVLPYEPVYPPVEEPSYREEPAQVRSRPLPPQPVIHPGTASPRSSPPKQVSQPARQPRRAGESPIVPGRSQDPFGSSYHRDKESSPLPQRSGAESGKRNGSEGKNASPPYVSSLFLNLVRCPDDTFHAGRRPRLLSLMFLDRWRRSRCPRVR